MSVVLKHRAIKSVRKPRRCFWCAEMIEKGESAITWSGVFEGDFSTTTVHPECWGAICEMPYPEDGFGFGESERGCNCPKGECECEKAQKEGKDE